MSTQTIFASREPGVQTPPGDTEALARLRRWGGEALVQQLACVFLSEAARRVAAARSGAAAGDQAAVRRAMHALRSSCGQLGAVRMQEVCVGIDDDAAAGDLARVRRGVATLPHELERYRAWVATQGVDARSPA